jgi:hypothetical protein
MDSVEVGVEAGDGPPEHEAERHRQEDPERQEPVEERQASDDGLYVLHIDRWLFRGQLAHL